MPKKNKKKSGTGEPAKGALGSALGGFFGGGGGTSDNACTIHRCIAFEHEPFM